MARELITYTLDEVADILKLTKRTLYTYIKKGQLRAVKFGKYWRVTQEELESFLTRGVPRQTRREA